MSKLGRVIISEAVVLVELGDTTDLMFSKTVALDKDQIDVVLLCRNEPIKETVRVTVDSKTILGALKALEAVHDRSSAYKKGR